MKTTLKRSTMDVMEKQLAQLLKKKLALSKSTPRVLGVKRKVSPIEVLDLPDLMDSLTRIRRQRKLLRSKKTKPPDGRIVIYGLGPIDPKMLAILKEFLKKKAGKNANLMR
mgnify:CR=1 FL=1